MLPENEHNMAREFFLALDVEVHGQATWHFNAFRLISSHFL